MLSASDDIETDAVHFPDTACPSDADVKAGIAVIDLRWHYGEAIQRLFDLAAKDVRPVVAIHADKQATITVDFAFTVASHLGLEVGYLKLTSEDEEDSRRIDSVAGLGPA